jgi:signal peptidase I
MRKMLRFLVWTAIVIGAIVGAARATAIRWWRLPADDPYLEASVAPSLRGGDLVILWRLTKPKFGDLVVCPEPGAPERMVVGRIIAEPGDNVLVEGQKVQINESSATTEEACKLPRFTVLHPTTGSEIEQGCSMEVLGGHLHMRGGVGGHAMMPRTVKTRVEAGKVFLLSDNRLLPYDSRDFGQVDVDACTETVVFRLVSAAGFFDVESRLVFIQ